MVVITATAKIAVLKLVFVVLKRAQLRLNVLIVKHSKKFVRNNWVDKITISDLRVPTLIGVHAHERSALQTLLITATLSVSIDAAAQSDVIEDALDYTRIHRAILDFGSNATYQLLEAFAVHLANHLKTKFQLDWLQLSITKKPADMSDVSGVTLVIER